MTEKNQTLVIEFILMGLTDQPTLKAALFLLFLVIYLVTMMGNLGLIALIWKDRHLHTPMYLFLSSLAFADSCTSSSVIPKMLINFLSTNHAISLVECFAQFYFMGSSATTECFLLSVMAYDCYVAICKPLLYPVLMSNRLCTQFIAVIYLLGVLHLAIHVGLLLRLTFCRSNIIQYYYCEILQLFSISCVDPSINMFVLLVFSISIQAFTFVTIMVSYVRVLFAIMRKKSEKGRRKAFSTCSAHLLSVSLFYGTIFLIYGCPGSGPVGDKEKMLSLFYTVIIPLLNPFVYSLRNKEVIGAFRRVLRK
uniref:olfactory receptor 5AC1-like n=1 Tax=Myodes glareolus TaxID=447135 RepID=UPI00202081D5|nr:olfactory receptor 5AC1-like [Myodes glareolus]